MAKINEKKLLTNILEEIKSLRGDLGLLIPTESINGFSHPSRIKKSYSKALKQYPIGGHFR